MADIRFPEHQAAAAGILRTWRAEPAVGRLHEIVASVEAERTSRDAALAELLEPEEPSSSWLARFDLDQTLAALALLLAWARSAAETARTTGKSRQPLPTSLVNRCAQFGAWRLKRELDDASFAMANPQAYREVSEWLASFEDRRRDAIEQLTALVAGAGRARGLRLQVTFDPTSIAGVYRRLQAEFSRSHGPRGEPGLDRLGRVRVTVPAIHACYSAVGAVHAVGLPEPGGFRDLIATPRGNGHSGLETSVWIDPGGHLSRGSSTSRQPVFSFIIQTPSMAQLSSLGIAHPGLRRFIRGTELADFESSGPGFARLAHSLLGERTGTITVFTARGEARQLTVGATALDLAYRIHTEVGDRAVAAEVNGRRADLRTPLPSGAQVRVIVDRTAEGRSEQDLEFVVEPGSRRRIVQFLNREPVRRGRHAVATYLRRRGLALEVPELDALVAEVAEQRGLELAAALYRSVAEAERLDARRSRSRDDRGVTAGMVGAEVLRRKLEQSAAQANRARPEPTASWVPVLEQGWGGARRLRLRLCARCRPAPTAEIAGVVRRQGVTVHRQGCSHLAGRAEVSLGWRRVERPVRARLRVLAEDRPRILSEVLERAHELDCGVAAVEADATDPGAATIDLALHLRNAVVLVNLVDALSRVRSVRAVLIVDASLPASLLERIRRGPADEALMAELEADERDFFGRQALVAPQFVVRRGAIRLPYSSSKPAHSPRAFVGRQTDAAWLATQTVDVPSGGTAFISGPSRVGKTSLCLRYLDHHRPRPEIVRADLRSVWFQDTGQAFATLLGGVSQLGGPRSHTAPDASAVVELVRRGAQELGRPVVLVLDEFGGPIRAFADRRLGPEFFDVVPRLMDLELPLSVVMVAAPAACATMQQAGLWSRLRACSERRLGALEPDDARRMIVSPFQEQGIEWEEQASLQLANLAGRLPVYLIFLLQEVVHDLNADTRRTVVRVQDVGRAAERLLRSDGPFAYLLQGWQTDPVRGTCLRAIVRHGSRGSIGEEELRAAVVGERPESVVDVDDTLNELVADGLVVRRSRTYHFAIPLFWRWLRRNLTSNARSRALGVGP